MAKMISANKLNRLWKNGVVAKMIAKTKVLKTIEEISANTNGENVAGAMAVKELNNNLLWKQLGTVTGAGSTSSNYLLVPDDAKEILVSIYAGFKLTCIIPADEINESTTHQIGGFDQGDQAGGVCVHFGIAYKKVYLWRAWANGNNIKNLTATTKLTVYYR